MLEVKCPHIVNSNKLQIELSGFFNYTLVFHRFHHSFFEGI